ncbi:MAG: hypothetical protein ABSG36_02470 [Acidimicrobiales bacterium]
MRRNAVLSVILAGAVAFGAAIPGASPASATAAKAAVPAMTHVLSCLGEPELRPASYVISCADANASWHGVTWTSWGPKLASGAGDLYQNDCNPNCAAGHFRTYQAVVVLSVITRTKKYGALYTKAVFSYLLKGKHKTERFYLAT